MDMNIEDATDIERGAGEIAQERASSLSLCNHLCNCVTVIRLVQVPLEATEFSKKFLLFHGYRLSPIYNYVVVKMADSIFKLQPSTFQQPGHIDSTHPINSRRPTVNVFPVIRHLR